MAVKTIPHNPLLEGLVEMRGNVPFASPDGKELCLQLLKPEWSSGGKGFPLVVFIQGSAWQKPNQFRKIPYLSQLAARGYVIASVTHRSCWEAPAPAFLQDVKSALRFLRAHAEEFDIDKERVCAWGTSSGGNTALLVGLTAGDPRFETGDNPEESTAVNCVVDCFGPTDLVWMESVQLKDFPRDQKGLFYALGGTQEDEALHEKLAVISPTNYVTPGRDLPPFQLLYGDADPVVLWEEGQRLYDKMQRMGYEADFVRVEGAPHEGSFWSQETLETIFSFIERHIGA